ncbi:MAG: AAA family ATPase, partial [Acidimicrobiales bacterium]
MSRREIDLSALTSVIAPVADEQERRIEVSLRPSTLGDFVGQRELVRHLEIVLGSARARNQSVDHLLFAGPPGLGKTSLAGIVAAEMGSGL